MEKNVKKYICMGFPGGPVVKNPPVNQGTQEAQFQDFKCVCVYTHKHIYSYVSVNHFAIHKKLIIVNQLYFNKI